MGKYARRASLLSLVKLSPFVEAGGSVRTLNVGKVAGFTTGMGASLPSGHFKIAPELRYTRWQASNVDAKWDEVLLLVGVSF